MYKWDNPTNAYKILNDSDYLELGVAYWIFVTGTQPIAMTITGNAPANRTINLPQGWNLIGCPFIGEIAAEDALWPLQKGVDYGIIWEYESGGFSQASVFKPGRGYWIYMIKNSTLVFPLELIPPNGTIKINNDSTYSNSASVTLNITAEDNQGGSGVSKVSFSNDNINWAIPEDYAATKNWSLSSEDGIKTVYAKFRDACGNWSGVYSDSIILDTTPAAISITSPLDGAVITDR
ncbi:MAG: hypothetical protein KJ880_03395 [Candidatus Omnitrophica bacterium]|nr:hypothetical protein [Candidatus Omnitrophota bacterium]